MGDSYVGLSLLKNDKYNAPLADSGQVYRKCLTSLLLFLNVIEVYYPQVWITLQQSPYPTVVPYRDAEVVRWGC